MSNMTEQAQPIPVGVVTRELADCASGPPRVAATSGPDSAELDVWAEALAQYRRTLEEYVREIDEVALRLRPTGRSVYREALIASEKHLARARPGLDTLRGPVSVRLSRLELQPAGGAELAALLFGVLDMLEAARVSLVRGAAAALDPNLRAETESRMSRTYTEGLDGRARELDSDRRSLAQLAAAAARWAGHTYAKAVVGSDSLEAVAAAYADQLRGAPSAALYADLLGVYSAQGHSVGRFVELAKEEALGALPDSAATIEQAAGKRASLYHPLQAMGLTFAGVPGGAADTQEAAMVVDMTLPQARESVVYDLGALIDEKRAGRGSAMLGLNFKLVARLDTIRATPIGPNRNVSSKPEQPAARFDICRADCGHGVARTVDGGQSYEWMDYPSPRQSERQPERQPKRQPERRTRGDEEFVRTLPAGPRERVAAFNILVQQTVLEGRLGALVEDRERLLERYEEGKDERSLEISSSATRSAVETAGVVAAGLSGPSFLEEREKLERAAGKLLDAALDRSLLRPELVGSSRRPELSGALQAARSETALTMLLRAESLAEELEKRVKNTTTLQEAFPDTEPPEIAPSLKLYALAYK